VGIGPWQAGSLCRQQAEERLQEGSQIAIFNLQSRLVSNLAMYACCHVRRGAMALIILP